MVFCYQLSYCLLLGPILIANCLACTLYAALGLHFSCHAPTLPIIPSPSAAFAVSSSPSPTHGEQSLRPFSLSISRAPFHAAALAMRFYFYATLVSHCIICLTPLGGALVLSLYPVMALLTQLLCPVSDRRAPFILFFIFFLFTFFFFFFNCKCEHFV